MGSNQYNQLQTKTINYGLDEKTFPKCVSLGWLKEASKSRELRKRVVLIKTIPQYLVGYSTIYATLSGKPTLYRYNSSLYQTGVTESCVTDYVHSDCHALSLSSSSNCRITITFRITSDTPKSRKTLN